MEYPSPIAPLAQPQADWSELSERSLAVLLQRVADAFEGRDRKATHALALELQEILHRHQALLPQGVQDQLREGDLAQSTELQIFALGQVLFAKMCASLHARQTVTDGFEEAFTAADNQKIIALLAEREFHTGELSEALDQSAEHISRKLMQLRESGVTQARRSGRHIANALTPMARQRWQQKQAKEGAKKTYNAVDPQRAESVAPNIPPHLEKSLRMVPPGSAITPAAILMND